jgi:hypothetical protein
MSKEEQTKGSGGKLRWRLQKLLRGAGRPKHKCGFCPEKFGIAEAMYAHQSKAHDPDHIMISDIGLPK